MTSKPHFYVEHGYWNCRCDGFHGSGLSAGESWYSLLKMRRVWFNMMNFTDIG